MKYPVVAHKSEYGYDGVEEIINLQSKGSKAKPYQVKQVRNLILKYKLWRLQNGSL